MDYVTGSIVDHPAQVLVNTVNSRLSPSGRGVMGKGVAKAFADKWPTIMRDYEAAIRSGELKPGRALLFDLPDGRKWAALATKDDWRDPSQMKWVDDGLRELGQKLRDGGFTSVALTPPGCGNGKLDWKKVEPLVYKHLHGLDVAMFARPANEPARHIEDHALALRSSPDQLAQERDDRIKKLFRGVIVAEPEVSFSGTLGDKVHASFSMKEHGGNRAIRIVSLFDPLKDDQRHALAEDIMSLKAGDELSLAGNWTKHYQNWIFKAERMARGAVPLEGLRSQSLDPAVFGNFGPAESVNPARQEIVEQSRAMGMAAALSGGLGR